MKIASLDIETGSTKTNAMIFEIGIIKVEVPTYAQIDPKSIYDIVTKVNPPTEDCQFLVLPVNFQQQSFLGRDLTEDTLKFHCSTIEMSDNYTRMMRACALCEKPVQETLEQVRSFCSGIDELWVNGLSFDPVILKTLQESVGDFKPLWKFRAETDVRSLYRIFELDSDVSAFPSHVAISDCVRNLCLVRELGIKIEQQTLKFRTKLPYTKPLN